MNIIVRKNVTLSINADATVQAAANVTGKSQGDIISEAVLTPKLLVTAAFDKDRTVATNPVANMIDMYRQTGDCMTMMKSRMLVKFVREFFHDNDILFSSKKMANFAEFFLSCLSGMDSANGERSLMEFSVPVLELDIFRMQKDTAANQVSINPELINEILYAMQTHIADRRVYANTALFQLLVIALQECIETAADLIVDTKSIGIDTSDDEANKLRPVPDWDNTYMAAAPVIGFIF